MNNVLLVNTSFRKNPESKYSSFGPPMGLLSIASALKTRNYAVELIDPQIEPGYLSQLHRAMGNSPLFVGMSTYLGENVEHAVELSRLVKTLKPDVTLVLGGPLASSVPEVFFSQMPVDYIVMGSGEATVLELADALSTSKDPRGLPHISYKRDGEVVVAPLYCFDGNLDDLPLPDLALWAEGIRKLGSIPIITSRGCNRGCAFCYNTFTGKHRYYLRSPGNVIGEMDYWSKRFGMNRFELFDDNFLLDSHRALTIIEEMVKRKWIVGRLFGHLNEFDRVTPEQLARCASWIVMCIESASCRIQKLLNKRLDIEKALALVARISATKAGFVTAFMFGLPTETDEDIRLSVELAGRIRKIRSSNVSMCYIYVPQPKDAIVRGLGPAHHIDFSLEAMANVEVVPVPPDNKLDLRLRPWMSVEDREFYLDFVQVWQYHFAGLKDPGCDLDGIYTRNERVRKLFDDIPPPTLN